MMYLGLIIVGVALEQLLFVPVLWQGRKWLAALSISLLVIWYALLLTIYPSVSSAIFCLIGVYRILNLLRIFESRMHEHYLRRAVASTSRWIGLMQLISAFLWWIAVKPPDSFTWHRTFALVALIQVFVAVLLLATTLRTVRRSTFKASDKFLADKDLPTVTLAIPARNETPDLTACLELALASDYPKLEILVLDDCSQDKTSDLVRAYAQAGIRFIHGHEPKNSWLAKNQAYDQLTEAATGEFIIFCGVDTRMQPGTIKALILAALNRNKDMICVLPRRGPAPLAASLIQPMRYWWELALPRRLLNRPAVLSSFWLIRHRTLLGFGGFDAVASAVIPEAYFARQLVNRDAYSFIRSSGELGVVSSKSFSDQLDRAIRLRYPEVHRRMELVLLLSVSNFCFLLLPFAFIIYGIIDSNIVLLSLSLTSSVLLLLTHSLILRETSLGHPVAALFSFPLIILTEIALGNASMLKYEFSTVDWKGRNICLPVMQNRPFVRPPRPDSEQR